jgi:periplasmic protein TonB
MLFKSMLFVIAVFGFTRALGSNTLYFRLSNSWNTVKDPNGFYTRECISDSRYCTEEQDSVPDSPKNPEVAAEFPGGKAAWINYLSKNLHYPSKLQNDPVTGQVVLRFTISPTGAVENIVVVRSLDPLIDAEAIRVISKSPKWKPAEQLGAKVPSVITQPINF